VNYALWTVRQFRLSWGAESWLSPAAHLGLATACCSLVAVCGCSRGPGYPSATVSGTVTIDGQPVPKGQITFSPAAHGQGPVIGSKIAQGKYRCERVPLGQHRVTFAAQAEAMSTIIDVSTGQKHEVPKDILPPRYLSGLDAEVKAGKTLLDFPLQTKP
jgi:hypothetical protein